MSTVLPRRQFRESAVASYGAMFPDRIVLGHLVGDPMTELNDAQLRQGVISFVAEGTSNWTEYTGREGQYGTLKFSMVAWGRPDADNPTTAQVAEMEEQLEAEMLQWFQTLKPEPLLDAVYPKEVTYSSGLDTPYAWIVMRAEALYV